jgi:hypothetical protein
VLGRFRESDAQVAELIERACEHVERVVLGEDGDRPEIGDHAHRPEIREHGGDA